MVYQKNKIMASLSKNSEKLATSGHDRHWRAKSANMYDQEKKKGNNVCGWCVCAQSLNI
jgi:hypothetical protein